ncbi:hypothetical protein CWRG_02365 [Chthonomonas calidirosea]|uniref:hypothetical protein n=1 Tax=Chthonomonas calidirosea TaxID=454171 RepID=UPI0006DD546F|nr:hypothetical protein [Chthonomonas calidirosea]CEK19024.1 hypothetical protein CWRG_02365 [Chthonomonas calidirosea]
MAIPHTHPQNRLGSRPLSPLPSAKGARWLCRRGFVLVVLALLGSPLFFYRPATAQKPYRVPQYRRPKASPPRFRPSVKPSRQIDQQAIALLKQMFHPSAPYSGLQRTQIGDRYSEQQIWADTHGRIRIQYLAPPQFAGDIMLILPGHFFDYHAREHRLDVATLPTNQEQKEIRQLVQGIRSDRLQAVVTGEENVAGRDCAIVTILENVPGQPMGIPQRKFWIDRQTGIVLRKEVWNARGMISATYMVNIAIGEEAGVTPQMFSPSSLPRVADVKPLFPSERPQFPSIEAAQPHVPFPILRPTQLPEGYVLSGIWLSDTPNNPSVVLRYSRGLNYFSLTERRVLRPNPRARYGPPAVLRGMEARWLQRAPDGSAIAIIYIGHLTPSEFAIVANSLQ